MKAPKRVRRLWTALGALLILGLAGYVHFVLTGSYQFLVAFFNFPGAAFFLLVTCTEVYFAFRARSLFEPGQPMHMAWTLVFLSACCRLTGTAVAQVGARIPWNPLVIFKALQSVQSEGTRSIGIAVSGPVATALLAAGLTRVIVLQRRLGILGRLSVLDKSAISILMFFTFCQLFEIGRVLLRDRTQLSVAQVVLWFSDPLLTLLLIESVLIRRSVLNMGQGLVARCWGMMALGAACTAAGDAFMWADWHGFIPVVIQPFEWFIWFFPVTAFASAPCYQLEAARLAHQGSYSGFSVSS